MQEEIVVDSRNDREIRKQIITPGDYTVVPFEESRCKITLSDVKFSNSDERATVESQSIVFSPYFNGMILIGDTDSFIDRDFEILLQHMCSGETCLATFVYRDDVGVLANEISCKVELMEVTEEQLISDWSWQRLFEAALHHKEKGVLLVKEKRIMDGFRRFSKAFKFLVAMEPLDPKVAHKDPSKHKSNVMDTESLNEIKEVKGKLYNNLAHCQLQFEEYEAAIDLCTRAIKLNPVDIKAFYRRSLAYSGLNLHQEAWDDIQSVLKINPTDRTALQRALAIKPQIVKINKDYVDVMKKMFS